MGRYVHHVYNFMFLNNTHINYGMRTKAGLVVLFTRWYTQYQYGAHRGCLMSRVNMCDYNKCLTIANNAYVCPRMQTKVSPG